MRSNGSGRRRGNHHHPSWQAGRPDRPAPSARRTIAAVPHNTCEPRRQPRLAAIGAELRPVIQHERGERILYEIFTVCQREPKVACSYCEDDPPAEGREFRKCLRIPVYDVPDHRMFDLRALPGRSG